jgi:rhamnogalacturonan endolyase
MTRQLANLVTANWATDPALYRSATVAGEWNLFVFVTDSGILRGGKNSLVFKATRSTLWRGFMWDSVILEYV